MANSIFSNGVGISGEKTVTTAGTREAILASTEVGNLVRNLTIVAKEANTGQVYVGGTDVDSSTNDGLAPGDSLIMSTDHPKGLALFDIFLDVDTDGEGVDFYGLLG